jgi:hypothetical protein
MNGEFAMPDAAMTGPMALVQTYAWLACIGGYLLFAFLHYKMAFKTGNDENAWWAFVPIMNTLLLVKMAAKPMWWFWLLLIPVANVVAFFSMWISAAQRAGRSGVWGFLVMIPVANLVAMIVLAFGERQYAYSQPPTRSQAGPQEGRRAG